MRRVSTRYIAGYFACKLAGAKEKRGIARCSTLPNEFKFLRPRYTHRRFRRSEIKASASASAVFPGFHDRPRVQLLGIASTALWRPRNAARTKDSRGERARTSFNLESLGAKERRSRL